MSDTQTTPKPDDSASEPSTAVPPVVTWEISTRSIWQVIGAILLTLVGVILVLRARDLVAMLIISSFFSLALIPLVDAAMMLGRDGAKHCAQTLPFLKARTPCFVDKPFPVLIRADHAAQLHLGPEGSQAGCHIRGTT